MPSSESTVPDFFLFKYNIINHIYIVMSHSLRFYLYAVCDIKYFVYV